MTTAPAVPAAGAPTFTFSTRLSARVGGHVAKLCRTAARPGTANTRGIVGHGDALAQLRPFHQASNTFACFDLMRLKVGRSLPGGRYGKSRQRAFREIDCPAIRQADVLTVLAALPVGAEQLPTEPGPRRIGWPASIGGPSQHAGADQGRHSGRRERSRSRPGDAKRSAAPAPRLAMR